MSRNAIRACLLASLLVAAGPGGAEDEAIAARKRLPITLEAASSQYDRLAERVSFDRVVIRQGEMTITADRGQAARLDFENSRWLFEGNVVLDNQGARVECDSAELKFAGYELRSALLRGAPVTLVHRRPGARATEARATAMDYDVATATIRLSGEAWLSDGANEFSGDRIAYDLTREYVTADAGTGGDIRMKIKPPRGDDEPAP